MADVKISALPTASVVNPADILVLNQGGTTKTATKTLVVSGLATTAQISGIATTAQLSAFQNSAQVQALASAQIAAITPASIGALSTAAASGFATTGQISGFTNSAQVQSLASAQIAAITPASIGAFATSAIVAISNGGTGATDAVSALANLGGITSAQVPAFDSAQLSAYVLKSGSTMDGRLVMAATTAQAKANIGGALPGVAAPSSTIAGDVWVSNQSRLAFSPSTGVVVTLAGTSQANTFNQTQTIGVGGTANSLVVSNNGTGRAATFTAASSSAAVAILQTGAGEAFRVEDETSPDATAFVISSSGRVGIGVTPDAVTALSVDGGGIKFADGSIATTALSAAGLNSAQVQALTTAQLSAISINAGEGLSGGGNISASRTLQLAALTTEAISLGSDSQVPTITVDTFGRIASTGVASITPDSIGAFSGRKWENNRTYNIGDIVSVDDTGYSLGQLYISETDGNISKDPRTLDDWTYVRADAKSIGTAEIIGNPTSQQTLTFNSSNGTFVFNTIDAAWVGAAPLDSPAFTGTPTAPTAAAQTNTTQIATTEFVLSNSGDRYLTDSDTPNTITNGTKTFTVESGLSYTPTQDCTIVFNASNHMHGVVVTYSGTTLVVDVTQHTGSGSYSVWTINVGGLTTAAGALLSANNLSDVANTATALTNIGGVSTARTISAGTGLTGGGDLTANRTMSIAALSPDPTGTYGSTSQIPSLTVNNLGQVTAASSLAMPSTVVQVFSTPGTFSWTKPNGAKQVVVELVSGGNGGGAGGKIGSGTAVYGGTGGGGGGYSKTNISASDLEATCSVVVGAAGSGSIFGGAVATQGGASSFANTTTPTQYLARATSGGTPGQNGGTASPTAGSGGAPNSNAGGASSISANAGAGSGSANAPTGGGGGGGISTSLFAYQGGAGATNAITNLGSSGGAASSSANGVSATPSVARIAASLVLNGSGGGGGGSSTFSTGSGGNGANGSGYGSGGGGGGATIGTGLGGNGGNGAPGIVVVTTYF